MKSNNFIDIEIKTQSPNKTLKLLKNININIYKTTYQNNQITIKIKELSLDKIKKLYPYKITKYYGIKGFLHYLKTNYHLFIDITIVIILILFYTRIIVIVKINTNNIELSKIIKEELNNNHLQKYHFIKNDKELNKIKEQILNNNKDKIEWLNIQRVGMNYIIDLQRKIKKETPKEAKYCHLISTKSSTITRIINSKGTTLVETNDSVKEGDVLITGDIFLNEEIKGLTCAEGIVYGKTWYTINVESSKTYKKITKTQKKHHNLVFQYHNKTKKAFKDKYSSHLIKRHRLLNLFGFQIIRETEYETKEEIFEYTEQEFQNKINNLLKEKLNTYLPTNSTILEKKVLNKWEKDSTIEIEIFIVVEEPISKKVIIEK